MYSATQGSANAGAQSRDAQVQENIDTARQIARTHKRLAKVSDKGTSDTAQLALAQSHANDVSTNNGSVSDGSVNDIFANAGSELQQRLERAGLNLENRRTTPSQDTTAISRRSAMSRESQRAASTASIDSAPRASLTTQISGAALNGLKSARALAAADVVRSAGPEGGSPQKLDGAINSFSALDKVIKHQDRS